jgi:hypothetical protein
MNQNKCLVIMIGNARGGEDTWNTAYKNLIDINNADLAICFGKTDNHSNPSLYKKSKYVWEIEEYSNWREYYAKYLNNFWEKSLSLGIQIGPIDNRPGSAAIQFAIKHFLLHNFLSILETYKNIIITRSDYFYLKPDILKSDNFVWIPNGENYGGVCDRHIEFHSKYLKDILNIFDFIDSEEGYRILYQNKATNSEQLLKLMYMYKKIPIKRYPRKQFTVATSQDSTRWKKATTKLPGYKDLYIKYDTEYREAINNI